MADLNNWTIAYRRPGQPVFRRKDLSLTWAEAYDMVWDYGKTHPEHDVFYVPTRAAELTEFVGREDIANILLHDGTRVPIVEEAGYRDGRDNPRLVKLRELASEWEDRRGRADGPGAAMADRFRDAFRGWDDTVNGS